jgi:benzoate-CoA ligase family protein
MDWNSEFNVAAYFVDRNVLERRGENAAVECGNERVSYRQLLEQTNRVGNALRLLGVRREERVLLLLSDTPEFLYCFFGAIKIGAVSVPLNTMLKPHEYEYLFNDARARVAIVSETLLPQLDSVPRERFTYLKQLIIARESNHHLRLRDVMGASSPELHAEGVGKDAPAFWLYSSGSTGPPKACVHSHRDMVVCAERYAKGILQISERDRCYSVARLFFAYGLGNAGYFPLYAGATTILSPARPTPASTYADIERYKPTLFFSVPSNYAALVAYQQADGREFDLSSVRLAISAGEPLPVSVFERFKKRFGIEILDGLGSTETLQTVISNRPGEARAGSSGQIVPGYEAKIVDESGNTVAPGEIGTLMIRGDSICSGYWNQKEKTEGAFIDHWFRTGDRYYQDPEGYFWHAGRANDLFKVNGRWLNPVEVEAALLAHPAVKEAAVVPREDQNGLVKPAAYLALNPEYCPSDELAREIVEWVAQRIGGYKSPRSIEFVLELPKTATGKVQRFKLRQPPAGQNSARSSDRGEAS